MNDNKPTLYLVWHVFHYHYILKDVNGEVFNDEKKVTQLSNYFCSIPGAISEIKASPCLEEALNLAFAIKQGLDTQINELKRS